MIGRRELPARIPSVRVEQLKRAARALFKERLAHIYIPGGQALCMAEPGEGGQECDGPARCLRCHVFAALWFAKPAPAPVYAGLIQ